jgi:hypothetical protein
LELCDDKLDPLIELLEDDLWELELLETCDAELELFAELPNDD